MRSFHHPLHVSIVRVRNANGQTIGMGFLIAEQHICTCAHVVQAALNLPDDSALEKEVRLDFPFLEGGPLLARVTILLPPQPDGGDDIAVLQLLAARPSQARPVDLKPTIVRRRCQAYGIPDRARLPQADVGVWEDLVLGERVPNGWVQMEAAEPHNLRVQPGFSGAPVWDNIERGVVGMVASVMRGDAAFLIPSDSIQRAYSEIRVLASSGEPIATPRSFLAANGLSFISEEDDFFALKAEHIEYHLSTAFVHGTLIDKFGNQVKFDSLTGAKSLILFGEKGCGKTSYCYEIARFARYQRNPPALVVQFNLAYRLPTNPSTERFLNAIIRATLDALGEALKHDPHRMALLRQDPNAWDIYQQLERRQRDDLGFGEWLERLSEIVHAADFDRVYFLVDGFEQFFGPNIQLTVQVLDMMIRPILVNKSRFTFKFFLPLELEKPLRDSLDMDLDVLSLYRLGQWQKDQLREVLAQRLNSFSSDPASNNRGFITSFQQLCDRHIPFDVDAEISKAAGQRPIELISIIEHIINRHCQSGAGVDTLISYETIRAVLGL